MSERLLLYLTAFAGALIVLIGLIHSVTPHAAADVVVELAESLPPSEAVPAVANRLAQGQAVIYISNIVLGSTIAVCSIILLSKKKTGQNNLQTPRSGSDPRR
jgi:hypothetical protein